MINGFHRAYDWDRVISRQQNKDYLEFFFSMMQLNLVFDYCFIAALLFS